MQPAALTALLGLLMSGTAAIGTYALVVPLVILQAVTAAGWFRLNGMWPARQGIALAFAGAVTADVALLAAGRGNAPAAILGTLGAWVLLTLVLQLRSHADAGHADVGPDGDGRLGGAGDHRGRSPRGGAGRGDRRGGRGRRGGARAGAAVADGGVGGCRPAGGCGGRDRGRRDDGPRHARVRCSAWRAAVCALIGHRVASYDYPSRFVHFTAGVALPLAAAAPAVYLVGRALV